jgi:hypothetical protein
MEDAVNDFIYDLKIEPGETFTDFLVVCLAYLNF